MGTAPTVSFSRNSGLATRRIGSGYEARPVLANIDLAIARTASPHLSA